MHFHGIFYAQRLDDKKLEVVEVVYRYGNDNDKMVAIFNDVVFNLSAAAVIYLLACNYFVLMQSLIKPILFYFVSSLNFEYAMFELYTFF